MKNLSKLLLLVACTSVSFYACKKDRTVVYVNQGNNTGNNGNNKPTSIRLNPLGMLSSFAPKPQTFTLNSENYMYIYSSAGNEYVLPPKSLLHTDNSPVTGSVEFKLVEYRTKGDMLSSGVTTMSGKELLVSGSMFYLMAYQNQEELKVKPNTTLNVSLNPNDINNNSPMDYWIGTPTNDSNNRINWGDSTIAQVRPTIDSGGANYRYKLPIINYKFGYSNLDCLHSSSKPRCKLWTLKLPSNCNDTNTSAMIIMQQYNACGYAYWTKEYDLMSTYYSLPIDEPFKLVICRKYGEGNDDIEYAIIDEVVKEDTDIEYTGTFTKTTSTGLKSIIDGL